MKLINRLDDQGRFCGLLVDTIYKTEKTQDSHGASYLYVRNQFKEIGLEMGLDLAVSNKDLYKYEVKR